MDLINICENIYYLKGAKSSNIYILNFNKTVLIDTGHKDEIDKNFDIIDKFISIQKIDYILNTHSHGDHNGANSYLKKINPDIKIFNSEHTKNFQEKRKSKNILKEVEDQFDDYEIDFELKNNDIIDLENNYIKVIESKGHTSDSVSFYLEKNNIIFTGDIIYNRVITQLDYYQELNKSLNQLIETYHNLYKLNINKIYTGHGDPIENPKENIEYCLKKLNRFTKDPEMVLVNNMVPTIEFYIHKNNNCNKEDLYNMILTNMLKLRDDPFLKDYDSNKFSKIIEKTISLMKILNIIREENNKFYLNNLINEYIGVRQSKI